MIQQESGGHEYLDGQPITSSAGAMGLMQLMPQTYADMQDRYGLGPDPYDPHDNIMAGTGYIRILADKYGAPAFLAAYNAGPQRLESYLNTGRRLPNETVNYVASITPHLGTQIAMTGPLAVYATTNQLQASQTTPTIMQPYNETTEANTFSSPNTQSVQTAWASKIRNTLSTPVPIQCDPNTAYNPDVPCALPATVPPGQLPPPLSMETAQETQQSDRQISSIPEATASSAPLQVPATNNAGYGTWAIQVGAFSNPGQARFAATMARQAAFTPLQVAQISIQPTIARGTRFWRARLGGISRSGAAEACSALSDQGMACMAVPPTKSY